MRTPTATGEEEEGRTRKRNVACRSCHHPWTEHKFGKNCKLVKRSGMAAPNHLAACGCLEFKEPKKRRRIQRAA